MIKSVRVLCVVLSVIFVCMILASCADDTVEIIGDTTVTAPNTDSGSDPSVSDSGFVFEYNGAVVEMDAPAQGAIEKLGDGYQYFESASCAFEGIDKTYIYPHFELLTYPSKDGDKVQALYIKDDLVATKEGLKIGSSIEDMERLYGTSYTVTGSEYTFTKGGMELKIQIKDEVVSYITYASKVLGQVNA